MIINFYHLETNKIEDSLPSLIEKVIGVGGRALIKLQNDNRIKYWDDFLWSYNPDSFIPHGTYKDVDNKELQPILLTSENKNINVANYIFLLENAELFESSEFEKCFILFSSKNSKELEWAREIYKNTTYEKKYYKQNKNGWSLELSSK